MRIMLYLLCLGMMLGGITQHVEGATLLGPRATGMGGAMTAVVDDITCVYWNPAGLTRMKEIEICPIIGIHLFDQVHETLEEIYDYVEKNKGTLSDAHIDYLKPRVKKLEGKGVVGDANISFLIGGRSFGVNWAVSSIGLIKFGAKNVTIDLEDARLSPDTFKNNTSTFKLQGSGVNNIAVTYAERLKFLPLSLGVNLKYINGTLYNPSPLIVGSETSAESGTGWADRAENREIDTGNTWGVDLGILYKIEGKGGNPLTLALVVRNINSPKISLEGGEIKLDPEATVGIAFNPFKPFLMAVDYDLTSDETILGDSRRISFGLECNLLKKILSLRAGAFKDLGLDDSNLVYSAGFGVRIPILLALDVGGAYDLKERELAASGRITFHF
ncbi:MAG: conjugal transfer protein TraF [bacterium]